MKQLIEDIAKALVDIPDEVAVRVVEGEQVTVLELRVAPSDLGLNFRKFQDVAVAALLRRDVPRVSAFAEMYRVRMGTRLVAMRVERHGDILTRDGLQPAPPMQLPAVSLQAQ